LGGSKQITKWFVPEANIEPWIGGAFELFFDPSNHEKESTKGCIFTSIEDKKKLEFTWKGPRQFAHFMNNPSSLTIVEVLFKGINGTTHLTVNHRGWHDDTAWKQVQEWLLRAWNAVLVVLKSILESDEKM
jgi:uncharacterized protein YndB with AHSA1/START domain